ncbi:MAG: type ISP restriction/modification enzyme, partial [Pyrinomonadaceae bacterium]
DKDVKAGKSEEAIFKLFSRGIGTYKDEWLYDYSKKNLEEKMRYFIKIYEASREDENFAGKMKIKWDEDLVSYLKRDIKKSFDPSKIYKTQFRPFVKSYLYFDNHFIGRTYQWLDMFKENEINIYISFNSLGNTKGLHLIATNTISDLHLTGDSQTLPLYTFDSENQKHENITDWGLTQFRNHYKTSNGDKITKEDIFYYAYAALHAPAYRKKYGQNLKREFPRLPFYDGFFKWRDWGKELMDLHVNYETVEPFDLIRADYVETSVAPVLKGKKRNELFENGIMTQESYHKSFEEKVKTKLRADKSNGSIVIDSHTILSSIPPIAWEYKLGNRSALEWILDQYKERKPSDATIAEKFNTYKFEDYKEQVIDLLRRVTTVSVRTMEIINRMPQE